MTRFPKLKFIGSFLCINLLFGGGVIFLNSCNNDAEELTDSNKGEIFGEDNLPPIDSSNVPEVFKMEPLGYVVLPDDIAEQYKGYTGFNLSFNKDNHTPNYVAWELTSAEIKGSTSTSRDYWVDSTLEGCLATDYGWSSHQTWERGHMCPAADQTWSPQAMKDAAVMANMCPQHTGLNGRGWARLEDKSRDWAMKYGKIMIVSGPLYSANDTTFIGKARARVPEACFKAILYYGGPEPQAIGFILPNMVCNSYMDFAMSIDNLEKETGFDFFSALPDEIENEIEKSYNKTFWQ